MTAWSVLSARVGRNDLPALLFEQFDEIDVADRPRAVARSWSLAEFPERLIPASLWIDAFGEVGYAVDGVPTLVEHDLAALVTLYRGCTPERRDGMSWTPTRSVAEWFRDRFAGMNGGADVALYRIEIPREYVLARITDRGETEVVVDTASFTAEEYEQWDGSEWVRQTEDDEEEA